MNGPVQMPVCTYHNKSSQMGGNVHDSGLLDPSGPATYNGHLLAHDNVARQFVMGGKRERIDVDLKLV